LGRRWTDLYTHGEKLNWLCRRFFTEFKKAEENDDGDLMIIYGEALRKVTMNCVDVARCRGDSEKGLRIKLNLLL